MYPSPSLGKGLYSIGDLPDTIIAKNVGNYGDLVLYKGVYSGSTEFMGPIGAAGAYWGRSEPEFVEEILYYQEDFSEIEGWAAGPGNVGQPGPCLFSDLISLIEDEFEDTYQISGPISGTVTRVKSCLWRGAGLTLRYDGAIPIGSFPQYSDEITGSFKWKVNGGNKSGFQNTPVGSYAGGFIVS